MIKQDENGKEAQAAPAEAVAEAVPLYKPTKRDLPFEEGKRYTYSDYCTWDDETEPKTRYELIDGIPIVMSAPNRKHQNISMELSVQLGSFLKDKPCKVYAAPFDVRMNADGADDTVVQPDILVICDHSKLTDAGCNGAPDMAIEILSPGSARHDRFIKLQLYERFGVREYWIVDPEYSAVTVYILDGGRYYVKSYTDADTIPVHVLEGCTIDLKEVFV